MRTDLRKTKIVGTIGPASEHRLPELFEAGLNDLRFSIDAIKKETYEKIRKGLDYDQVVRNVLDVIKYRNQNYPQVSIRLRLTQREDNFNEVDDLANYRGGGN